MLIRSAFSANIKERRDCSTALFDERGRMIAQAEHIPVHLGAMPDAVAAVMRHDPGPDDVFVLNDPYAGGTHLPDVTLVSRTDVGFAVSRAHHADVGGVEPGSMPAGSRTLADEGVVIPPTRLDDELLDELVARMRNPDERRGDFRAQLAAHALADPPPCRAVRAPGPRPSRRGDGRALRLLGARRSSRDRPPPRRLLRGAGCARGPRGRPRHPCHGHDRRRRNHVRLRRHRTAARRQPQLPALGHALGLLLRRPLPDRARSALVRRRVCARLGRRPRRLASSTPRPPAAVAAGNVETSGRIVDTLFAALGEALPVPAQGQGTMNNLTFGNERFTYYETIGGGQGACADADGPSAVHVTMSNTLTTPAEALELAYPLRVERHALRLGLGRRRPPPRRRRRRPRAARPRTLPRLGHLGAAAAPPRGARGGEPGQPGRNYRQRRGASVEGDERPRAPATSSGSRPRAAAASARPARTPLPSG